MTKDNREALREKILRALMTAPNQMAEANINGKYKTFFEVHDYNLILFAVDEYIERALPEKIESGNIIIPSRQFDADTGWNNALAQFKENLGLREKP